MSLTNSESSSCSIESEGDSSSSRNISWSSVGRVDSSIEVLEIGVISNISLRLSKVVLANSDVFFGCTSVISCNATLC